MPYALLRYGRSSATIRFDVGFWSHSRPPTTRREMCCPCSSGRGLIDVLRTGARRPRPGGPLMNYVDRALVTLAYAVLVAVFALAVAG